MKKGPHRWDNRSLLRSLLLAWICVMGWRCGGGASFENGVFRDRDTTFCVGMLPADWKRLETNAETDVAWYNRRLEATIFVNATCEPDSDIPLEALTKHLLFGFTEKYISSQERTQLDGREALVTTLVAKLDGVPRKMVFTVLKKDGCVYDFSLIGAADEQFTQAMPLYQSVVSGFHAESRL
jgi:hypothetical protein